MATASRSCSCACASAVCCRLQRDTHHAVDGLVEQCTCALDDHKEVRCRTNSVAGRTVPSAARLATSVCNCDSTCKGGSAPAIAQARPACALPVTQWRCTRRACAGWWRLAGRGCRPERRALPPRAPRRGRRSAAPPAWHCRRAAPVSPAQDAGLPPPHARTHARTNAPRNRDAHFRHSDGVQSGCRRVRLLRRADVRECRAGAGGRAARRARTLDSSERRCASSAYAEEQTPAVCVSGCGYAAVRARARLSTPALLDGHAQTPQRLRAARGTTCGAVASCAARTSIRRMS